MFDFIVQMHYNRSVERKNVNEGAKPIIPKFKSTWFSLRVFTKQLHQQRNNQCDRIEKRTFQYLGLGIQFHKNLWMWKYS